MDINGLVDPELRDLLAQMPAYEVNAGNLAKLREALASMAPPLESLADESLQVYRKRIGGADGSQVNIAVLETVERADNSPVFLHFHGGGFVMGAIDMTGADLADKAKRYGALVVSVDYTLAPDAQFPAQIEEARVVLDWIRCSASELRIDPSRIVLMGESAGAGLAFSVALWARANPSEQHPPVRHLHLLYPMLDDTVGSDETHGAYVGRHVWSAASNRFGWGALLGPSPDWTQVAPLLATRAPSLEGLPYTFMAVGSIDLFAGENLRVAERLVSAGVPTELHLYPGAYHGFQMAQVSRCAGAYHAASATALERALAGDF